jgi:hypothetical protein
MTEGNLTAAVAEVASNSMTVVNPDRSDEVNRKLFTVEGFVAGRL